MRIIFSVKCQVMGLRPFYLLLGVVMFYFEILVKTKFGALWISNNEFYKSAKECEEAWRKKHEKLIQDCLDDVSDRDVLSVHGARMVEK